MALVKVITGGKNSGKTTMLLRLDSEYRKKGLLTSGFISEAEYSGGKKSSYFLRDIENGSRILSVTEKIPEGAADAADFHRYEFSKFYFYIPSFKYAAARIDEILGGDPVSIPDIIFLDEIGPLELSGNGHIQTVERLLAKFDGSLIIVIRDALLDELLEKLKIEAGDIEILRTPAEYQV